MEDENRIELKDLKSMRPYGTVSSDAAPTTEMPQWRQEHRQRADARYVRGHNGYGVVFLCMCFITILLFGLTTNRETRTVKPPSPRSPDQSKQEMDYVWLIEYDEDAHDQGLATLKSLYTVDMVLTNKTEGRLVADCLKRVPMEAMTSSSQAVVGSLLRKHRRAERMPPTLAPGLYALPTDVAEPSTFNLEPGYETESKGRKKDLPNELLSARTAALSGHAILRKRQHRPHPKAEKPTHQSNQRLLVLGQFNDLIIPEEPEDTFEQDSRPCPWYLRSWQFARTSFGASKWQKPFSRSLPEDRPEMGDLNKGERVKIPRKLQKRKGTRPEDPSDLPVRIMPPASTMTSQPSDVVPLSPWAEAMPSSQNNSHKVQKNPEIDGEGSTTASQTHRNTVATRRSSRSSA
ncbi:MAG: hypothetical protein Q9170_001748 [Blastenia crenularia]